jgi:DNA-binding CsgD family transcriptional regulator
LLLQRARFGDEPVRLWAGDLDRARTLLERARRIGYDRADNAVRVVLWYAATLEWLADRWLRGLELANELCELGAEAEYESAIAMGLGGRAVILAHLGDEEQTRRAVAEAVAPDPSAEALALLLTPLALGPLELSLERPREELDHIRPATADARSKGIEERAVRLDRESALACIARCRGLLRAARGDEAGAVAAFERALGAKLWGAKARRELARIGGRTRTDGLTETERRVAELVAVGRANKEIASELFVTVRTVESHLTKVYAKLGVHSRTELVSRLSL